MGVFKDYIKRTPVSWLYIYCKTLFCGPVSQSDEGEIIERLVNTFDVPKAFIEFGFSGWEFNCAKLAMNSAWEGFLADGDAWNIAIAQQLFHKRIVSREMWITLDTLDVMLEYARSKRIGVLSVDVDGNDYWLLEKLIAINPAIIVAEFNVSLGLLPVSVPYDPAFDRTTKHESREYYGASLSAICHLCTANNYSLLEISRNGVNAFFVRNDLLHGDASILTPEEGCGAKYYPDGLVAPTAHFWQQIKHLPYVDVTQPDANFRSRGTAMFS